MRWALLAIEEVIGKQGMAVVLRDAGLEYLIDNLGDRFSYVDQHCWQCAGKAADEPICLIRAGTLQEALHWLTGQEFEVHETECRAVGAPACVWEILKTPTAV